MEEMSNTTTVETEVTPIPTSIEELQPKMKLNGTVTRLELYGAFIDVGVGVNALVHISRLSTGHVNRVSDVLTVGDEVTLWIDKVDPETKQIIGTLTDDRGNRVRSSKFIEIHFRDGDPIRVGQQMGMGRVTGGLEGI